MRRISCFAMLAGSLFYLTACSLFIRAGLDSVLSPRRENPFIGYKFLEKCIDALTMVQLEKSGNLEWYNPLENLEVSLLLIEKIKG